MMNHQQDQIRWVQVANHTETVGRRLRLSQPTALFELPGVIMIKNCIAFLLCILVIGCDAQTVVRGKVTDKDGNPLAFAKVWLIYGTLTSDAETSIDGMFSVEIIHGAGDGVNLLVSSEGYKTYFQTISKVNRHINDIKIALDKGNQKDLVVR